MPMPARTSLFMRIATASLLLVLLVALPTSGRAAKVPFKQWGLTPMEPPVPAAAFSLDTVAHGRRALKDDAGRWVVLTFFATWCGPCMMELPSLALLQEQLGDRPVQVLGVAIDQDAAPVRALVAQKHLNFPIFLDTENQVAARYQASSVPVSYLINPQGQLVAISRGARDWSKLRPLFDALVDPNAAPNAPAADYAAGDNVEIPPILRPPSATVSTADLTVAPDQPFSLDVKIRWSGTLDEYLLKPPGLALPDGVHELGTAATTSTVDGDQVVTYSLKLQIDREGRFVLDPVEVRYTALVGGAEQTTRVPGPTLDVAYVRWASLRPWHWGGLTAALVALSAMAIAWRHQRNRRQAKPPQTVPNQERERLLTQAQLARQSGDHASFLCCALALEQRCAQVDAERVTHLQALLENARYGGGSIPSIELDDIARRLTLLVAETTPNQASTERQSIRFAKS